MIKHLVVKQQGSRDCGACSLLSIIRYYKGNVSLEKLRTDTNTTNEGTTFFHLLKCGRKYGLEGNGLVSSITALQSGEVKLPVIAHLEYFNHMTHFVVIYKISKKHVTIMDPNKGIVKIETAEFENIWTKRILIFYPIHQLLHIKENKNFSYIFSSILPVEKTLIIKLFITSVCLALFNILTGFYFKIQIDAISDGSDYKKILLIFLVFLIFIIIKQIITFIRDYLENYLNKNIDIRLVVPFVKHIFLLPLNIIRSKTTGEITSRVGDLNSLKNLFSKVLITIVVDLLLVIAAIFVLLSVSNKLFGCLCFILIIYIFIGLIFSPIIYKKVLTNIEAETDFNSELIEKIGALSTIKSMHNLNFVLECIESNYLNLIKNNFKFSNLIIGYNFLRKFIDEIGLFLLSSLGVYMIYNGSINFVTLITFNSLLIYLFDPIKNIIDLLPNISNMKIILEKVADFYNIPEEELSNDFERFSNGDIVVNNLSYSYNDYSNIFENLNINIRKGEKVFLKGPSGCGKSTLCKILFRLYEPSKGIITIDNLNIKDYKLNTIRSNITYLGQKEEIFSATIKDNILFGRLTNINKLNKILSITRVDEIINKKSLRLDSVLLDGGYNLSGGEKQRIVLARALIKKSEIFIFDEALSEISSKMEKAIIKDILKFCHDKTVIYVSHRNNERLFDRVIELNDLYGY